MRNRTLNTWSRRKFLTVSSIASASLGIVWHIGLQDTILTQSDKLSPGPVPFPHFPDRLYTYIWRNWTLVPLNRLARVVKAQPSDLLQMGRIMGLEPPPVIPPDQERRTYITIIRRNWHLLPNEQIIELLGWTMDKFLFILQEDDFLWHKLGRLKPECSVLTYKASDMKSDSHVRWISRVLKEEFPSGFTRQKESLFQFIRDLSVIPDKIVSRPSNFSPRFCYSYFALYGDPLLDLEIDPFPEGYLAQLAVSGVDGVWLQGMLTKLVPFPWDSSISTGYKERIANLKTLIARAKKYGIRVYLYMNEPRSLPISFFDKHPSLKGIKAGDRAALCTSHPDVQQYLEDAVASIVKEVPDLGGFFTITASENLTNCWSIAASKGDECLRCSKRSPADVMSEVNAIFLKGIQKASGDRSGTPGKTPELIAYDWAWSDSWNEDLINKLPLNVSLMSVSEKGINIERGGIKTTEWDYSMSIIGPGSHAKQAWEYARKRGIKPIAKIQANNTWEISAVPYIPVVANVAQHISNLRKEEVKGLMLSWTLGGYPSPNLEVVAVMGSDSNISPDQAMEQVARRRYGEASEAVVQAWKKFSTAFNEFPFGRGLYVTPLQMGPANLLWSKNTGFAATMVGLPYDDIDAWSRSYPLETFISQLIKVAEGFQSALADLIDSTSKLKLSGMERSELSGECRIAETIAIHFRSAANQTLFVEARRKLEIARNKEERKTELEELENLLHEEIKLARRMNELQRSDSRLGFEATNHYYYVPHDLVEKVINCRDLLDNWLPREKGGS
jgi:hypothetical protein